MDTPKMIESNSTTPTRAEDFLTYPHIRRLNRNLRKMFMQYLSNTNGQGMEFEDLVADLELLFEFLDEVEK